MPGYDCERDAKGCWFDAQAADDAVEFIETCVTHIEGDKAGSPFILEAWQKAIVGIVFGWKLVDDQGRTVRRYREVFLYVPRKNGKTPLVAAIALLILFTDPEAGQQDFIAAASKDQAGAMFRQCAAMIRAEPLMAQACRVYGGSNQAGQSKSIVKPDNSFLRVIAADADTQHGGTSHFVAVDELHAQGNGDLIDVLTTSTSSLNRKQPLFFYVTTADFDRPSICNEKHAYACQVRDGIIENKRFLPIIYQAEDTDDWEDPATWRKANPNLGVSVSEEYLAAEIAKAKKTPRLENTIRRLHLNQKTAVETQWISLPQWDLCGEPFSHELIQGQSVSIGLDFGWRDDYAAMVAVWKMDDLHYVRPWFWLPKNGRRDKRVEPTATFLAEKLVTLTEGNSTDIEAIYLQLRKLREICTINLILLDPANARKQGQDLMNEGFEVREFIQSKRSYNEPCRVVETLIRDGKLRHAGHKVLRWMASNTMVESNGLGEIMPAKAKSAGKIDGIVAMVMAEAGLIVRNDNEEEFFAAKSYRY